MLEGRRTPNMIVKVAVAAVAAVVVGAVAVVAKKRK